MYNSFSISKCVSQAKIAARCNFCQDQDQQFLPVHLDYKGTSNGSIVNLQLLKSYKEVNGQEESVSWL